MAEVRSSRHAAAFLGRRLDLLPGEALRLLIGRRGAGQGIRPRAARRVWRTRRRPRRSRRCTRRGAGTSCWAETERDAAASSCTTSSARRCSRGCADEERRRLHSVAASRIEQAETGRVFELAYHFDAAGESERGLAHTPAAAERGARALRAGDRRAAIPDRRARRQAGRRAATATAWPRAWRRADAARPLRRGRRRQFEAARVLAEAPHGRARDRGQARRARLQARRHANASEAIEHALRGLARSSPAGPRRSSPSPSGRCSSRSLHTSLPRLFLVPPVARMAESSGSRSGSTTASRMHLLVHAGPGPELLGRTCAR